jgi:hypothetical protein
VSISSSRAFFPLTVTLLASALAGCSAVLVPHVTTPAPPTDPLVVTLATPDGVVGVARQDGLVLLFVDGGDSGRTVISRKSDPGQRYLVSFTTQEGDTGDRINTHVFGVAPNGAMGVQVAIRGRDAPSALRDGLFVAVSDQMGIRPDELSWRFVGADGTVIAAGVGRYEDVSS